jgi:hypothetical protein
MGVPEDKQTWLGRLGVTAFTAPAAGGNRAPAGTGRDAGEAPQDIADRIGDKIKADGDLRVELAALSRMDMRALLDLMARLKKSGKLEAFADRVTGDNHRIGVAILTTRPDFDAQWQGLVAQLNDQDRKAVLERVPPDVKVPTAQATAGSARSGKREPAVDTDAVIAVGPDGAEVQAKLTFHSSVAGNLGETEFTVHIGPNGKLSQFEVDVTAIKEKLEKMGALSSMLELEATLSLNATVALDQHATRVVFGQVQAQVKGEIEMHFKEIEALKKVAFKLTATAGSGGFSVTGSIEIAIPGT